MLPSPSLTPAHRFYKDRSSVREKGEAHGAATRAANNTLGCHGLSLAFHQEIAVSFLITSCPGTPFELLGKPKEQLIWQLLPCTREGAAGARLPASEQLVTGGSKEDDL